MDKGQQRYTDGYLKMKKLKPMKKYLDDFQEKIRVRDPSEEEY